MVGIASFAGAAPCPCRLDYGWPVTPPLERYLQIRSAYAVGALPGGELGYLSDVTGIFQLWQVAADGLHDQLTFAGERVTAAVPSPTEQHWVIGRDVGGNERHQLIRVDSEGQELALTDDPDAIHVPGAFSPDGRRFAFTHTGRNGTDFDVALVGLDASGRRELARPGGYCAVVDWSEAGILVAQLASPFDHHLFLLDPDGDGTLRRLTPEQREGQIAFTSAALLADGSVLCSCDLGSEFERLGVLRDGQVELLTPDDADVEQVLTDGARTRRAWTVNRGGYAELYVDGQKVEGLPIAALEGARFLPDGRISVTAAPPDDTVDAWIVGTGTQRGTRSTTAGIRRSTLVRPQLRSFESFDGLEVPYFLYGDPGRPTLLYVHGGPEAQFRPQLVSRGFFPVLNYLVGRGLTVCAPNVRGSTGYGKTYHHLDDVEKRLDSVQDLCALARHLEVPVAVMGGSYGGYMTMAAITEEPELWSAAVNTVGIVNFVTFLERTGSYRRALREAEYGSLEHDRELLERISPIRKVDEIRAPLMVIHGANDPRVPISEAEQVVAALQARDHPVEYLRFEDEGHGIHRLANRLELYPRVAGFLERHLLGRS
jgi:dipeptidyl aminopeptidase/acylaminoacyl peptidase